MIGMFLMTASLVAAQTSHREAERWASETLAALSLEEKVAQMICEQMRGGYIAEDSVDFLYWSELARDYGIGGFVVYGGTPQDTAHLLNRLQKLAKIPLLISADFEGGPGQQFEGASEFPANMALAAAGSEALAYEVGKAGAIEGRAIGVHLTYSPVVDVQTRPENPVLSVRSFGSDVEQIGRMATAYIRGYQENGMLATAKHYPGRGDVDLIGDTEFLINSKPAARIEAEDLAAFQKAIDAGVTFVMSEHISIPSLTDGSDLPASVEPQLASYWLRERLGFDNVLTTDDLWYPKIVDRFGAERAGVLAIRAGHDVLLKPKNAIKTIETVVRAVRAGEIDAAQIDRSVEKLLYWKARLNLHHERFVDVERVSKVVGTKAHRDLVRDVAERSLTAIVNDGVFPTNRSKLGRITHVSMQKNEQDLAPVEAAAKLQEALAVEKTWTIRPNADPRLRDEAVAAAKRVDTVIVSLFWQRNVYRDNGAFDATDAQFLRQILAANSRAVVLSYGNPYLVEGLEHVDAFVVGYGEGGFYGNQSVYADAFIRLLKGEIEANGRLPVATRTR